LSWLGRATLALMRVFLSVLLLATAPLVAQGLSGRRAPSFSLPDSTTTQHDILDYRGNWLLVEFMQTDPVVCPTCKALSKQLDALKASYGSKAAVLVVVLSPPENSQTVGKFKADTKSTATFVFDQGQVHIAYFKATPKKPDFDVPHLFAIGPTGTIVKDWDKKALSAPGFAASLTQLIDPIPAQK
jgi:peroxiredoxin